jgi:hypothetical protein
VAVWFFSFQVEKDLKGGSKSAIQMLTYYQTEFWQYKTPYSTFQEQGHLKGLPVPK